MRLLAEEERFERREKSLMRGRVSQGLLRPA